MENDEQIAVAGDFTSKDRKAQPDLFYLNMEYYFEVSEDYKMKQLGDIVKEVQKGFKAGRVLKCILEYMVIADGRSKFFSRMCQYVFKNAPSISCVGNRKQQRIFLGIFIEQYQPLILRRGFESIYGGYNDCLNLCSENEDADNKFMKDLRLSAYILDHQKNSPICTWNWLYQKLSEKNRARFKTPDDFSSYFCDKYPELHNDHIHMCRPPLMQWIEETPITFKNSNVYIENGQILLLYDHEYLEENDLDNPDILHVPNVGFHLKSFNEDLNLPILLRKIIYNFLNCRRLLKRNQIFELLDELIADHSQPNLPQSTKSMLSEGLLFAIIKYGQHNIFWTTNDSFELFIEGHSFGKGDGQVILDILRIKYAKGEDISNEELFDGLSNHIKKRVSSIEDLEAFMTKYQSIFGPFEPQKSDIVNDAAKDTEEPFKEELTWEKLNQDVIQWYEKSKNTSGDASSTEWLESLARQLMKLAENAAKVYAAKRDQDDFENLAPVEDSGFPDNDSTVIDL